VNSETCNLARIISRYIDFDLLRRRGRSSATVVKLMMACNDMSLANQSLADWKKEQPPRRKTRAFGARIYFLRMQFGHLYEGLSVIEELQRDSSLLAIVEDCDPQTQCSYHEILTYQKGGSRHAVLRDLAGKVRHNLAFHYAQAGTLIERAIDDFAKRGKTSSVTRADTAPDWHFELADVIVDQVICRGLFGVSPGIGDTEKIDEAAMQIHALFLSFMDFSGEFIWRYCKS
jgi:hypothetical protein